MGRGKTFTIAAIIALLLLSILLTYLYIMKNKTTSLVKQTTIDFTKLLIEGKTTEAADLATGTVKYNLVTSPDQDQENTFQYVKTDAQINVANSSLADAYAAITYKNPSLNVVFYKLSLIKKGDKFLVYNLTEQSPPLKNSKANLAKTETFLPIFKHYLEGIEKQDFKEAGKVLIGKAKKAHNSTSLYIEKTPLVKNITELKADVVYSSADYAAVHFTYKNDKNLVSTLVFFYQTIEGWKIYEIQQV